MVRPWLYVTRNHGDGNPVTRVMETLWPWYLATWLPNDPAIQESGWSKNLDTWLPGCWVVGCLVTWLPCYLVTWLPGYPDTWVTLWPENLVIRTWLPGYPDTWVTLWPENLGDPVAMEILETWVIKMRACDRYPSDPVTQWPCDNVAQVTLWPCVSVTLWLWWPCDPMILGYLDTWWPCDPVTLWDPGSETLV